MTKPFTDSQFTPTEWDTSEDKAKFANGLVRFIESDFKRSLFTKKLYRRLSMMFGHIAHYDQDGFHNTWFDGTFHRYDFLLRIATWVVYGDPSFTYSDVEQALRLWVREHELVEAYQRTWQAEVESKERAEFARLQSKYGVV